MKPVPLASLCAATLALLLSLTPARLSARADIEYAVFEPSPRGTVIYSRSPVEWRILPLRGSRVTGASLALDGQPVAATYDRSAGAVTHLPGTALAPGVHRARAAVTLDGEAAIDKEWEFTVAPRALSTLPAPRDKQMAALRAVNELRRATGLPALKPEGRLFAAAQSHADYLLRNDASGHFETAGRQGFVGRRPEDRVRAFGYSAGTYEDVSQGLTEPVEAIQGLFDAPYHREPFLQPGELHFGAGVSGDRVSLLFGMGERSGVAVYPGNGQRNVPLSWDGNEMPDPLRLHSADGPGGRRIRPRGPFGYVVTLFVFQRDVAARQPTVRIRRATLATAEGAVVPAYINTPDNDDALKSGVVLIPRKPFRPSTTYQVVVEMDRGRTVETAHWSFTTAPE